MEKLLNAIASGLNVWVVVEEQSEEKTLNGVLTVTMEMFNHRDVTDEVRALFKKELKNHLFSKLQRMEVGGYVEYRFNRDNVRPLGTLMKNFNDNLAEVLMKLPFPKDGGFYDFPCNTYFSFTLTKKYEKSVSIMADTVCQWIMEAYSKQ